MAEADPKAVLTAFAAAVRARDWDEVRARVHPEATWYFGGPSSLAGQHHGHDGIVTLLTRIAALGFDRPGMKTGGAEILVGDDHHGIFWYFNGEADGAKVWSYEIWLAELDADGRIGAVFTFAEDGEFQKRFWG